CVDALGEPLGRDCDDTDARRFGGNLEVCDLNDALEGLGLDEDCDPTTFGAVDADGDSYFDDRCFNIDDDGVRTGGDDCSDGRGDVNPGTAETCDHRDNNCDGNIDEGVVVTVAPDADRDGFPVAGMNTMECPGFAGLVAVDDDTLFDCDDTNPAINPGQLEICDMIDNNCNDLVDDDTQVVPWYRDTDGDGFGSAASGVVMSCEPVDGATLLDTDCDDDDSGIHPASAEVCDGIDQDCNGRADFEISPGNFEDDDEDGSADIACGAPRGVDCDDEDANTGGGTPESCDGRDNDCDMNIDEGATEVQWFYDGDGDGHGTNANPSFPPVLSCSPPAGYVGSAGDCNDRDAARNPDATEDCNSVDDDCDGALDEAPAICDCPVGTMDCDGDARGICETLTDSDPNNCGGCGDLDPQFDCAGGPNVAGGICIGGNCIERDCQEGFDDCNPDPGCETPVSADADNCGRCGNECDGPNVDTFSCFESSCTTTCDAGWVTCGERCDTPESRFDCGSCGNPCGPGEDCLGGTCQPGVCLDGQAYCDGTCIDTIADNNNCGECGFVCPGASSCIEGECSCPSGEQLCDGACVVTSTNTDHCGGCGIRCAADQGCDMGVCTCPTDRSLLCGETCVDPLLDSSCGGCGNVCGFDQTCQSPGRCECNAPGQLVCDGGCTDTDNDPLNCGGCGNDCGVGGACNLGVCDPIIKVVSGRAHSCALRGGGAVVCWGDNSLGQVDADTRTGTRPTPQVIPVIPSAVDIAAGADHTCIVGSDTSVWCWGENGNDELGRGAASGDGYTQTPLPPAPTSRIFAGGSHTCIISTAGLLQCWGFNDNGQAGDPGEVAPPTTVPTAILPSSVSFDASDVSMGSGFTCALDVRSASVATLGCFGENGSFELGTNAASGPTNFMLTDFPFVDPPLPQMAGGNHHTCAALAGQMECWGGNDHGQCDPGTLGTNVLPSQSLMPPIGNVFECATRNNATCALTDTGVWCAGENNDGAIQGVLVPGLEVDDAGWNRLGALGNSVQSLGQGGQFHSCVIATNGVFCWGRNNLGQLGNGASGSVEGPVRVFALTP
ncbi:MAG: MopE-related protein, partial [Polyangiales bacterium]